LADPDPVTGSRYALATQNRMLVAFRRVLKECWRLGYLSADDYARAVDLPAFRGERLPRGRAVSEGELRSLFLACAQDPGPAGRRDAALFTLLRAGLRRAEAADVQRGDYDAEAGDLKVAGKGNKQRLVSIPPSGRQALLDWLAVRGEEPGPLFWRIRKGDRIETGVAISGAAVAEILERRRREVLVAPLTPHDWRRSFVGDLLDAGADLAIVQQLAGHASPATTVRYDRRPDAAKRKAAALLHVPYVPPLRTGAPAV
jgi:integrase